MDIFSVLSLFGGLALFLYGMTVMSQGLEKIAGGKLEVILKKMTSSPVKGMLLGLGITGVIQSSSAVTVMLVGLVNSGIMDLGNTVGVIMGSNIGTTVTAWLLSMVGIQSDNVYIKLLNPEAFSPMLALVGILMLLVSKNTKKKDIGTILLGFAILMYGMQFMSQAVKPLADTPKFAEILLAFNNPLLGVLAGLVLTAIIQSSSASVGILQALSLTGSISYGVAIPIIMGQNIGTCITAIISSIGVTNNAKRVAVIHVTFNIIGTVVCLTIFYSLHYIFNFQFISKTVNPVDIAIIHSIFNIFTTAMLLPFSKLLVKYAEKVIKTEATPVEFEFLDERLFKTPSVALSECNHLTIDMAHIAKSALISSMGTIFHYDEKIVKEIFEKEKQIDLYEDKLGSYLVKLASNDLSDSDSRQISKLLHTIGDFERIGDHAVNIVKVGQEISIKDIIFSEEGQKDIGVATNAVTEILNISIGAFDNNDVESARSVEPLEQVIDGLIEQIKLRHIQRLQNGNCTIEHGFVLSDIITNYERVSDHCSNIAVAIIELSKDSFETHEYLSKVKTMDNQEFKEMYNEYQVKYNISK